ncbi:MAG: hypothetical protein ACYC4Q_04415 [Victivallaceae bacterium]
MSGINIVKVEKALEKLIAERTGLMTDQEIFRGGLPVGTDGFAIAVMSEELCNEPGERILNAIFYGKNLDRDLVMQKISECAGLFPIYGAPGKLVDESSINFYAIFKVSLDFSVVADDGKVKTEGLLKLKIRL